MCFFSVAQPSINISPAVYTYLNVCIRTRLQSCYILYIKELHHISVSVLCYYQKKKKKKLALKDKNKDKRMMHAYCLHYDMMG